MKGPITNLLLSQKHIDSHLDQGFLFLVCFVIICLDKENPSLVFSGDREIPTRGSTVPVGNEASPSFTGTVDPRVGISGFHCTPMIDSISHISNKD